MPFSIASLRVQSLMCVFIFPRVPPSKARRLRAAAVKRKLWHRSGHSGSFVGNDFPDGSENDYVIMARHILNMNMYLLQWLFPQSALSFAAPVVSGG